MQARKYLNGSIWAKVALTAGGLILGWAMNSTRNTERIRNLEVYRVSHENTVTNPALMRLRAVETNTTTLTANQANIVSSLSQIQNDIREIRNRLRERQ